MKPLLNVLESLDSQIILTRAGVIDRQRVQYLQIVRRQLQGRFVFSYRVVEAAQSVKCQRLVEMPGAVGGIYFEGRLKLGKSL